MTLMQTTAQGLAQDHSRKVTNAILPPTFVATAYTVGLRLSWRYRPAAECRDRSTGAPMMISDELIEILGM